MHSGKLNITALTVFFAFIFCCVFFAVFPLNSSAANAAGEVKISRINVTTSVVSAEEGVTVMITVPENTIKLTVDPDILPFADSRNNPYTVEVTPDGIGGAFAYLTLHWCGDYDFFAELDNGTTVSGSYTVNQVDSNAPFFLNNLDDDYYTILSGGVPDLVYVKVTDRYTSYPESAASGIRTAYIFRLDTKYLSADITPEIRAGGAHFLTELVNAGSITAQIVADIDQKEGYYYAYAEDFVGRTTTKYLFFIGDYDNGQYDFELTVDGVKKDYRIGSLLVYAQDVLEHADSYKDSLISDLNADFAALQTAAEKRRVQIETGISPFAPTDREIVECVNALQQSYNAIILAEAENKVMAPTVTYAGNFKLVLDYNISLDNANGAIFLRYGETSKLQFIAQEQPEATNNYKFVDAQHNGKLLTVYELYLTASLDGEVYRENFAKQVLFRAASKDGKTIVEGGKTVGKVVVYRILPGGSIIDTGASFNDNNFSFYLPATSQYVIAFYEAEDANGGGSFPVWAIVLISIAGGVLVASGVVVTIIAVKKRKTNAN
ncbi:MAG: hypothetical protein LBN25_02445 [Christensenellaceae bacterium]|nr:hypothetical protein [Christensenellaceae bacterium]